MLAMAKEIEIDKYHSAESGFDDYTRVQRAIEYLIENWRDQPSLGAVAREVGLSETRFQKLFTRWAGLSPKDFVQALTIDHARYLLRDSASVLDTAYEVGLSGPGRLHDLFVTHEAMSPGEYKAGGQGLEISYGFHPSPFGDALIMTTPRGLAGLAFCDDEKGHKEILADMTRRWPDAMYIENPARTKPTADRIFDTHSWGSDNPLPVVLIGTDFEIRVWEKLLHIPIGSATTYGDIANALGKPTAARAVGGAVGRNPISFVVPCHRVMGKSGKPTGYHWGLTRKRAMIGWEAGFCAGVSVS